MMTRSQSHKIEGVDFESIYCIFNLSGGEDT